jgi:predicted ATPase
MIVEIDADGCRCRQNLKRILTGNLTTLYIGVDSVVKSFAIDTFIIILIFYGQKYVFSNPVQESDKEMKYNLIWMEPEA